MRKLILDSGLSVNNDTSQPKWRFSNGIRVHAIRLNTIILPLSFLNVHNENNVLRFGDGGQDRTATLQPGQYSGTQIADEVARVLTENGSQTYTVHFDALTGKLGVSAPGAFKFLSGGTTASKVVGLRSDSVPGTSFTFHKPVDLTGTQLLLLTTTDISARGNIVYASRESLNIIDAVPITVDLGEVLVHQNQMNDFIDVSDSVISEFSLQLLDSSTLRPLDLRGESFQVVLDEILI